MKRSYIIPTFFILLIPLLIIFFISLKAQTTGIDFIHSAFAPLQKISLGWFQKKNSLSEMDKLRQENTQLHVELAQKQGIEKENAALRDQFETANPASKTLLPATIVGMPQFFPGVSYPETLLLDKGQSDGVKKGNVVLYKDMVVGIVDASTDHFSHVLLTTNKQVSFVAKDVKTNALGVMKGQGSGQMTFENVLLSDSLSADDTVVTASNETNEGINFPPGFFVGKITSVEKNPSALFQKANVQSFIDVSRLSIVFVLTN